MILGRLSMLRTHDAAVARFLSLTLSRQVYLRAPRSLLGVCWRCVVDCRLLVVTASVPVHGDLVRVVGVHYVILPPFSPFLGIMNACVASFVLNGIA